MKPDHVAEVLPGGHYLEAPVPLERVAVHRGYNERPKVCYDIAVDGRWDDCRVLEKKLLQSVGTGMCCVPICALCFSSLNLVTVGRRCPRSPILTRHGPRPR